MASVDVDGQVIIRDITEPENPICSLKPQIEYEPPESATILFNQLSSLQAERDSCDIFVAINNQLFLYSLDGDCIKDASFSANIVNIAQDKEIVLLTMENSSIVSYNWQNGETIDEVNDYSSNDDE
jgi:hypothetical protein